MGTAVGKNLEDQRNNQKCLRVARGALPEKGHRNKTGDCKEGVSNQKMPKGSAQRGSPSTKVDSKSIPSFSTVRRKRVKYSIQNAYDTHESTIAVVRVASSSDPDQSPETRRSDCDTMLTSTAGVCKRVSKLLFCRQTRCWATYQREDAHHCSKNEMMLLRLVFGRFAVERVSDGLSKTR